MKRVKRVDGYLGFIKAQREVLMETKTKGIVSYLILAFGMAWGAWEIPIQLGLTPGSPLFQLLILPGAFAPAVSAVIVRKWITGEGFADAGLKSLI